MRIFIKAGEVDRKVESKVELDLLLLDENLNFCKVICVHIK